MVNATIPLDPALAEKGGYSRCSFYVHGMQGNASLEKKQCSRFVYDQTTYASSAVTKVRENVERERERKRERERERERERDRQTDRQTGIETGRDRQR